MKNLHLIRHGKSSWKDMKIPDFDRRLKKRGRKNTMELASHLYSERIQIDQLWTSPSLRTRSTADVIVRKCKVKTENVHEVDALYEADFATLLNLILKADDRIKNLIIIGHEPSISDVLNHFLNNEVNSVTTASLSSLTFKVKSWKECDPGTIESAFYRDRHNWTPKPMQ